VKLKKAPFFKEIMISSEDLSNLTDAALGSVASASCVAALALAI
jgi:hypothetical protein